MAWILYFVRTMHAIAPDFTDFIEPRKLKTNGLASTKTLKTICSFMLTITIIMIVHSGTISFTDVRAASRGTNKTNTQKAFNSTITLVFFFFV